MKMKSQTILSILLHLFGRLGIVGARSQGEYVAQGDCPAAYLNARLEEEIYAYLPSGHKDKDENNSKVYKVPAAVYGLKVSGKVWNEKFIDTVKEIGMKPLKRSPCLFKLEKNGEVCHLTLYVDDFLVSSTSLNLHHLDCTNRL